MTKTQLAALRRVTSKVDGLNRFLSSEPINGALAWSKEVLPSGAIFLTGNNIEGLKWYETCISVFFEIGVRGGVKLRVVSGLDAKQLKGAL